MKKTTIKIKPFKLSKKLSVLLIVLTALASIGSLSFYFYIGSLPMTWEDTLVKNSVTTTLAYEMTATMADSTLFSEGDQLKVDEVLMTKITDYVNVAGVLSIEAKDRVEVFGQYALYIDLVSDKRWQKRFVLQGTTPFQLEVLDQGEIIFEVPISYDYYNEVITAIEEETEIVSSEYFVKIVPEVEGFISYDDEEQALMTLPPFEVILTERLLKLPDKEVVSNNHLYKTTVTKYNELDYMGTKDLKVAQQRSLYLVFLSLVLLIGAIFWTLKSAVFKTTELEKVKKQIKGDLIELEGALKVDDRSELIINSPTEFMAIVKKYDAEILWFEQETTLYYYVLIPGLQYKYIFNKMK